MASQRIAVIGTDGQLGTRFLRLDNKGETLRPAARGDCTDANQVAEILRRLHPEVVIDCAACVRARLPPLASKAVFRATAIGSLEH